MGFNSVFKGLIEKLDNFREKKLVNVTKLQQLVKNITGTLLS